MGKESLVDNLWGSVVSLLFPEICCGCGVVGSVMCAPCMKKVSFVSYQLCAVCQKPSASGFTHAQCKTKYSPDRFIAVFPYRGVIRKSLLLLKYRDVCLVSSVCADHSKDFFEKYQVFIPSTFTFLPVPLHSKRLHERSYNQAALYTSALTQLTGHVCDASLAMRVRQTERQSRLPKGKARRKNVKGAFEIVPGKESLVEGQDFVIVDDIWTSGSTSRELSRVLKKAEARTVWVLTIARSSA